jgi:thiamine pyrophosphokinase
VTDPLDADAAAVIVFTGGDRVPSWVASELPADACVIAADSGVDHALALGFQVDLAVGDFDSVSVDGLGRIEAEGATIERHAAAKDETDFELALDRAVRLRPERIIVVGGHGGRIDHFLANALVLASPRYAEPGVSIEAWFGEGRVHVVRVALEIEGEPGDLVSLLPVGGPARGIRTRGLLYPLSDETLEPGSSRGVSNEQVDQVATITLAQGTLLVVRPGERGTHVLGRQSD